MHCDLQYFSKGRICYIFYAVLFLYVLFYCNLLSAQHVGYKQYTVSDGLPQSEIVSLFKDTDGYLWVGTKYGVSRFDGTTFNSNSKENGILATIVRDIGEIKGGEILSTTQYGYVIHKKNNPLKSFKYPTFRSEVRIFTWFDNNKAYTLIFNKNIFMVFDLTNHGLVDVSGNYACLKDNISDLFFTRLLYSPASNGFYAFNETIGLIFIEKKGVTKLPLNNIKDIIKGQDGYVYCLTNTDSKSAKPLPNQVNSQSTINSKEIHSIGLFKLDKSIFKTILSHPVSDTKFNPLFAFQENGKVVVLDMEKQKMFFYTQGKVSTIDIPTFSFSALFIDKDDNIWGGTSQGLIKFFPEYFMYFSEREGVNPDIQSIVADKQGSIWISSYYKGLQYIKNNKVNKFCDNPTSKDIPYAFYPGSNIDYFGNIHFTSSYIPSFILKNGVLSKHNHLPVIASSFYFFDDTLTRNFYYATVAGLVKQKYNSDSSEIITLNPQSKLRNFAVSIVRYSDNQLFIGGFKSLLIYSDNKTEKIPNANHPDLPGANAMVKDYKGNIWIGNSDGIYIYRNSKFTKVKNDYFNSLVLSLYAIDSSKLFIGGIGKIGFLDLKSYYDRNNLAIRCFDKQNGFIGGECQQNAVTQDGNGNLWIGCSNGVVRVDPKAISCVSPKAPLMITGVYIYREELTWDTLSTNQIEKDIIELKYFENNVKFEFTSTNSFLPENTFYTYKLEGFDKLWSLPANNRYATYTNLPPGHYRFLVGLSGGSHNQYSVTTFEFVVKSALWQRWYFYLLLGVFILGLSIAVVSRFLTRRNLIASKKLEDARRFSQLQFKALRNQLEPHFIFNALNAVGASIYVDEKQVSYDHLQQFASLIRTTLFNADKYLRSLKDELDFTKNYLELEKKRFIDKLDYEISISHDVDTSIQIPKLIIQTFVSHAISHGLVQKLDKGIVIINIQMDNQFLLIVICDNRKTPKETLELNAAKNDEGIQILTEYIHLLNQSLEVKIEFDLTELTNDIDIKDGNCVRIRIPNDLETNKINSNENT